MQAPLRSALGLAHAFPARHACHALHNRTEALARWYATAPVVLEHSVDVDVSVGFAWAFRTDVSTWNDPPATFVLDGPFASGSGGTTRIPGQKPLRWWIRDVVAERTFTIEMPLDRAAIAFEWRFEALSARRTRLTQRITLSGEQAAAYEPQVRAGFVPTLESGMARLATEMLAAERARG